jgi:hypothetical protein
MRRTWIVLSVTTAVALGVVWWWFSRAPEIESGWIHDVQIRANGEPMGETLSLAKAVLFDISFVPDESQHDVARWEANTLFGYEPFERSGPGAPAIMTHRWFAPGKGEPLNWSILKDGKPFTIPPFAPDDGRMHFLATKSASQERGRHNPNPPQVGKAVMEFVLYPHAAPRPTDNRQRDYGDRHLVFRAYVEVTEIAATAVAGN